MEMETEGESTAPPQDAAVSDASSIALPPTSPPHAAPLYPDDADSACSSPYFSAPSSPGRGGVSLPNYCYYFSAPTSPVHYVLASLPCTADVDDDDGGGGGGPPSTAGGEVSSPSGSSEFEFSARFSDPCGGGIGARDGVEMMCSADELFLNGQIRPMRLACHLERPQVLAPLLDLEGDGEGGADDVEEEGEEKEKKKPAVREEDEFPGAAARGREHFFSKSKLRSRSLHRRARSMSPLRTTPREPPFQWRVDAEEQKEEAARTASRRRRTGLGEGENAGAEAATGLGKDGAEELEGEESEETPTPSVSASSSRCSSSSSGRNSKRWIFLKDLLYRSKSEGRGKEREIRERIWHNISFSPATARDKAASLFVFSRAGNKLKETKPTPETPAAAAAAAEATEAEAPAASTDSAEAPAATPGEPTKQEEDGDGEKKKKQKPKPKAKPKLKKTDKEPGLAPPASADIAPTTKASKPVASGVAGKRRTTSAHERHYAAKRAQAEELRKRTFLPYRQGLLGCLGFSSRGYNYTAVSGLARTLNTVSSR